MPRTKKASRRGNYNGAYRNSEQGVESPFTTLDGASALNRGGPNDFTLRQEAQNTGRHHNFWNTDQRLRDTKVTFISAGALDSTKPKESDSPEPQAAESALADMTLDSPREEVGEEVIVEVYEESEGRKQEETPQDFQSSYGGAVFFVDIQETASVNTGLPPPQRAASPAPSNSSEEIILFAGRDQNGRGLSRVPKISTTPTDPIDAKIRIVEDKIHEQEELLEEVLHRKPAATGTAFRALQDTTEEPSGDYEAILSKKESSRNRERHGHRDTMQTEEDALIADYIANIQHEDGLLESFSRRELGGTEDELWQDETVASSGEPTHPAMQAAWNRDDIVDFDDLSTSDGVMGDVGEVLSKRIRASGLQYLVVWNDQPVDEARWVPVTTLSSVNALLHVEKFEAEEELVAELLDDGEENSDDTDNDMDIDDLDEDDEDNEDLLKKKVERMSDEQIARLLAKQEELGMGSEEILSFDDEGDDEEGDVTFTNPAFGPAIPESKSKGKLPGGARPHGKFPSGSLLADAYDGFDVMDFDRPSLKKKSKGRKGKLEFDISDSELEESMMNAWDNDRVKKKMRKQERENLRDQGLLGSRNGKLDLKQKYQEGLGIHAVKDEIKQFLIGKHTTLTLPPMEKADRKVVHELANAFKLKSKSDGSGKKRYPILYKTQQTRPFVEHTFDAIESRISHRFLPRMDVSGKRSSGAPRRVGQSGGLNKAAVSYRDGDIVGGSAPELGAENRGRAMLEKMGWSTGTALGALNNKGILQPVSHVVKTTKAGLG